MVVPKSAQICPKIIPTSVPNHNKIGPPGATAAPQAVYFVIEFQRKTNPCVNGLILNFGLFEKSSHAISVTGLGAAAITKRQTYSYLHLQVHRV
jgi:hypothetical protein